MDRTESPDVIPQEILVRQLVWNIILKSKKSQNNPTLIQKIIIYIVIVYNHGFKSGAVDKIPILIHPFTVKYIYGSGFTLCALFPLFSLWALFPLNPLLSL